MIKINEKERVEIGRNFRKIPLWKLIIGIPLIYIPAIITVPFAIIGLILTRCHLIFLGAKNLKCYKDFVPERRSFRYTLKNQITMRGEQGFNIWVRSKLFWFYNCGIYCPYTVALFEYLTYLIKVVENWWCPFYHDKKTNYADAPIDKSFWHISSEKTKLHKDDLNCKIWSDEN